jgi:hypothetical protein
MAYGGLPKAVTRGVSASATNLVSIYVLAGIIIVGFHDGYFHELFLRGRTLLALKMQRTKSKGTGTRKASSPETEPDFYSMRFVHDTNPMASPVATVPVPPDAVSPQTSIPTSRRTRTNKCHPGLSFTCALGQA